jgi:hypothetical protein
LHKQKIPCKIGARELPKYNEILNT